MTHKAVHYTIHARDQMAERGISRADVRWLLARGERRPVESKGPTQYWERVGYLGKHEASVVFIEYARHYLIVTVQWIE